MKPRDERLSELERQVEEIKEGKISVREAAPYLIGIIVGAFGIGILIHWSFPQMDLEMVYIVSTSVALISAFAWTMFRGGRLNRDNDKLSREFTNTLKRKCKQDSPQKLE